MNNIRTNSLDPIEIENWRWKPFLDIAIKKLSSFPLDSYQIPSDFLDRDTLLGSKMNPLLVRTSTWACKTEKIRQARAACVQAKDIASVLNLIISPNVNFDLPFFGVDFVTLPAYHLLALDFQPVLQDDAKHTNNVWSRLMPLHEKWQSQLPSGGEIPSQAKKYFSPALLWTKIPIGVEGEKVISEIIKPAFFEYISLYFDLIVNAMEVSNERSLLLLSGQKDYMKYRADNDPARSMFNKFYGSEWTDQYIHQVLFDL